MNEINHQMIVLAREYKDKTQKELARDVLVSQATIAKIEGGLISDAHDQLIERIAKSLGFPLSFFYQKDERLGFGSSSFYYRKRSKITASDRRRISSIVNLARISFSKLLSAVDIEANRDLPFMEIEEYGGSALNIAKAVRSYWSLPDGPISNLTALIESTGVIIIPCEFKTRFMDATSLKLTNMPPMIFINKNIPGDRWRFTLAHELAHLVMHDTPTETMEDEADAFASEFLVPRDEVESQFSRCANIRLQDLANLKPFWKVSMGMLLMKASKLGFIDSNQNRYLWSQMAKMGYKTKEPNEIEREELNNYPNLFKYYSDVLKYSVEDMANTVFIPPLEFESLHGEGLDLPPPSPPRPSLRVV